MTSYADQNEASPPLGAANCKTVATFGGSWADQRSGLKRRQNRMRPRRPWGLRTAKLSPCADQNEASPPLGSAAAKLSPILGASGRSSGVVPHVKHNEASPSLGAANLELTSRSWAPGRSSGVTSHAHQNETSTSLGAAKCETVATLVGFWVAQRRDVLRGSQ